MEDLQAQRDRSLFVNVLINAGMATREGCKDFVRTYDVEYFERVKYFFSPLFETLSPLPKTTI